MFAQIRSVPLASVVTLTVAFLVVFAGVATWAALRYTVPVAVMTAGGGWQLVDSPDWVPALVAGGLAGITAAALVGGILRHVRSVGWPGRWYLAATLACTAAVGVPAMVPISVSIMCDGSVPTWMLPDDYDGGGCVMYPVNWEQTLPWDDEDMYCLGMCVSR